MALRHAGALGDLRSNDLLERSERSFCSDAANVVSFQFENDQYFVDRNYSGLLETCQSPRRHVE